MEKNIKLLFLVRGRDCIDTTDNFFLSREAKLKEYSGELEKGKQAEEGGIIEPKIEKNEHDVKEAEAESLKKKSKKLIIRLKKSGGGEGSKQTQTKEGKDKESGEGKQAEEGGPIVIEKEKQPEHVREEAHDSAKTEDDKEGDYRSKEKRQVEDVEQAKSEKEKGELGILIFIY
uniref:Uncharacterized protein n=1 Tax=Lactuca sativa TaxID=4236 RepID=A0A9R1UIT3_LACSA|nr:hypothetical protein LSAT_V11C900505980 [Lactuca sativa]